MNLHPLLRQRWSWFAFLVISISLLLIRIERTCACGPEATSLKIGPWHWVIQQDELK